MANRSLENALVLDIIVPLAQSSDKAHQLISLHDLGLLSKMRHVMREAGRRWSVGMPRYWACPVPQTIASQRATTPAILA